MSKAAHTRTVGRVFVLNIYPSDLLVEHAPTYGGHGKVWSMCLVVQE